MFKKIKKTFLKIIILFFIIIPLNIIASILSFIRGNLFYGIMHIVVAIFMAIFIFYVRHEINPFYKMIKEFDEAEEKSWNMSQDEFLELDDEELVFMIDLRIMKVANHEEPKKCLELLNEEQKTFYIVTYFREEIENGGLCQFFVNASRIVAPFVGEKLTTIGADEYRKKYDEFVNENEIDLNEVAAFESKHEKDYKKLYDKYNFDIFDEAYSELDDKEPFNKYVASFIRENIGKLVEKGNAES